MKFEAPSDFNQRYLNQSACFNHLFARTTLGACSSFPTLTELNSWLPTHARTFNHLPVQFVKQPEASELPNTWNYERHIATTGEIPTRVNNWHDLFGAIMWCLFPKTKAVFNYWHHHDLRVEQTQAHQKIRSQRRHVITALDECGVLMLTKRSDVVRALQAHEWQTAFIKHRQSWENDIHIFMIGHANYEMMTNPFLGLTAKAWHIPVNDSFFTLSLDDQYSYVDTLLADYLLTTGMKTVKPQLFPLPLLGIPKWCDLNVDFQFYENQEYFRPSRGKVILDWDGSR